MVTHVYPGEEAVRSRRRGEPRDAMTVGSHELGGRCPRGDDDGVERAVQSTDLVEGVDPCRVRDATAGGGETFEVRGDERSDVDVAVVGIVVAVDFRSRLNEPRPVMPLGELDVPSTSIDVEAAIRAGCFAVTVHPGEAGP